uniref:C2H2-type domain-containing protein n=1 Tax=Anopheles atroparvus TaxID=41427 RepID=A0A182JHK8_ANOAO
ITHAESLSTLICPPCYGTVFNFAAYAESVGRNQAYLELLLVDEKHTAGGSTKSPRIVSEPTAAIVAAQASDLEDEPDREEADREVLPVVTHAPKKSSKIDDHLITQFMGFHCEVCDKKLDSFQALKEHCRAEHGAVGRVICCGKRFTRKDRLHTHILNHVQPDAFKCETCGQICKSKATLQAHRKQHLSPGERAHQCSRCEQRFVSRSQLTNHEVTHVPSEKRKHVCSTCAKAFAFKYVLVRHMKLHNRNQKEFVCEICAKPYSTESGLKQHLADHRSGEGEPQPRVQCTICHQWYKNRDTLRIHEHAARHTGKPLYECDVCGQTFNHSSNYSIHRKNKHQGREKMINYERQKLSAEDAV